MATKNAYIIIRVEKQMKNRLIVLAGGTRKLSEFIRNILEKKI